MWMVIRAKINDKGYVEYQTVSNKGNNAKPTKRDWFFVQWDDRGSHGCVKNLAHLYFDKSIVGKRIRLKMEEVKDDSVKEV